MSITNNINSIQHVTLYIYTIFHVAGWWIETAHPRHEIPFSVPIVHPRYCQVNVDIAYTFNHEPSH